jgi:cell division cycle 14
MDQSVEVIANELYWTSSSSVPTDTASTRFFSIDKELVYEPFVMDFGPLSLAATFRYCHKVSKMLQEERGRRKVVHVCSTDPNKRSNAACLLGCFQVIVLGRSASESWSRLSRVTTPFKPFRDATYGSESEMLEVPVVLKGLEKAIRLGCFDYHTFDAHFFEFYERVENGDFNWLIPNKMLAFAGPSPTSRDPNGYVVCTPEDFISVFRSLGVSLVVRLNKQQYDRQRFISNGVKHVDLYFADGSCPKRQIIDHFLDIAELEAGALAVHCKAGLGRTATLIGLYAMKHYLMTAEEFIGWARLARPGSILGQQHRFLIEMEHEMHQAGIALRATPSMGPSGDLAVLGLTSQLDAMSLNSREAAKDLVTPASPFAREDKGQGQRLRDAKRIGQERAHASPVGSRAASK